MNERYYQDLILKYALYAIDAEKKGLTVTQYSKLYNVDYKTLSNIHYRVFWLKVGSIKDRPTREKYVEIAKKFLSDKKCSISKYIKEQLLDRTKFTTALSHVHYMSIINEHNESQNSIDVIKEVVQEKEKVEPMKFISIKEKEEIKPNLIREPEQELIKKKNEIELIISKGIKVIVDSDVNTETMIRIIELLKDL